MPTIYTLQPGEEATLNIADDTTIIIRAAQPLVQWYKVVNDKGLNVRNNRDTGSDVIGTLQKGDVIQAVPGGTADGYDWVQITDADDNQFIGYYCAQRTASGSWTYLQATDGPEPEPEPPGRKVWPTGRWGMVKRQSTEQQWWQPTKNGVGHYFAMAGIRRAVWIGTQLPPVEHAPVDALRHTLDKARETGYNTIIAYAPLDTQETPEIIQRCKWLLDQCDDYGLDVWFVLTDAIRESNHVLKADLNWYEKGTSAGAIYHYLSREYFTSKQWEKSLLPFTQQLVGSLSGHPRLAGFFGPNEMSVNYWGAGTKTQYEAMCEMSHALAKTVHDASGGTVFYSPRLVCLMHTLPSGMTTQQAAKLLWDDPYTHFGQVHLYGNYPAERSDLWNHEALTQQHDFLLPYQNGVAMMIDELGYDNRNGGGLTWQLQDFHTRIDPYHIEGTGDWEFWATDDYNTTDQLMGRSIQYDPDWDGTRQYLKVDFFPTKKWDAAN